MIDMAFDVSALKAVFVNVDRDNATPAAAAVDVCISTHVKSPMIETSLLYEGKVVGSVEVEFESEHSFPCIDADVFIGSFDSHIDASLYYVGKVVSAIQLELPRQHIGSKRTCKPILCSPVSKEHSEDYYKIAPPPNDYSQYEWVSVNDCIPDIPVLASDILECGDVVLVSVPMTDSTNSFWVEGRVACMLASTPSGPQVSVIIGSSAAVQVPLSDIRRAISYNPLKHDTFSLYVWTFTHVLCHICASQTSAPLPLLLDPVRVFSRGAVKMNRLPNHLCAVAVSNMYSVDSDCTRFDSSNTTSECQCQSSFNRDTVVVVTFEDLLIPRPFAAANSCRDRIYVLCRNPNLPTIYFPASLVAVSEEHGTVSVKARDPTEQVYHDLSVQDIYAVRSYGDTTKTVTLISFNENGDATRRSTVMATSSTDNSRLNVSFSVDIVGCDIWISGDLIGCLPNVQYIDAIALLGSMHIYEVSIMPRLPLHTTLHWKDVLSVVDSFGKFCCSWSKDFVNAEALVMELFSLITECYSLLHNRLGAALRGEDFSHETKLFISAASTARRRCDTTRINVTAALDGNGITSSCRASLDGLATAVSRINSSSAFRFLSSRYPSSNDSSLLLVGSEVVSSFKEIINDPLVFPSDGTDILTTLSNVSYNDIANNVKNGNATMRKACMTLRIVSKLILLAIQAESWGKFEALSEYMTQLQWCLKETNIVSNELNYMIKCASENSKETVVRMEASLRIIMRVQEKARNAIADRDVLVLRKASDAQIQLKLNEAIRWRDKCHALRCACSSDGKMS